ncbi:MAG: hypothetical protein ACERKV_04205 [Clostridiaceae bacterium]
MKIKKISKKLAVMLSVVAITTSLGSVTACANESWDSLWSMDAWTSDSVLYETVLTNVRKKTDSTSAYGSVICGNDVEIPGNFGIFMTLVDESGHALTGRYRVLPDVRFIGNVEHYVPSNAYENNYKNVRMEITREINFYTRRSVGKWSSDSY